MEEKKSHKGGIILLWVLGALVILVAVFIALSFKKELTITINGDNPVDVPYGTIYMELGAKAKWKGSILSFLGGDAEVVIDGTVDTSKVGTYEIRYSCDYKQQHAEAVRTVNVTDTEAPVITLKTEEDHYTLPGKDYEEEGYTAIDNVDGDITSKVIATEKNGVVTYTVTDSSGNSTEVTRTIFYDDREAPVITFEGVDAVMASSEWKGSYKAQDNVDGDLTSKVVVTGSVDTNTPGTYELTYTVADSYNNKTEVTRTVTVYSRDKGSQPWGEQVTGEKIVFLTFDDGPGAYTEQILNTLNKYGAKATFFVTNQFPDYNFVIAKEAEGGHTVAVLTASHDNSIYSSSDTYWADYDSMNDIIEAQTGLRSDIFRFPSGSANTVSYDYNVGIMSTLVGQANDMGLDYYDWNVDSGDWDSALSSEEIAANVIAGMEENNISVVLLHDVNENTAAAIESIIKYGQSNGYTFMAMYKGCFSCHQEVIN